MKNHDAVVNLLGTLPGAASAACCAISGRDARAPGACFTHSYRSASRGSTRTARRAGTQQASRATPTNKTPTPIRVSGSAGWTPKRNELKACDSATAARAPTTTPATIRRNPSPKTSFRMSPLPGADRAPDGQFAAARSHGQRKNAVDPNQRQRAPHQREPHQQVHCKRARCK